MIQVYFVTYLKAVPNNVLWSMWIVGSEDSGELLFQFLQINKYWAVKNRKKMLLIILGNV